MTTRFKRRFSRRLADCGHIGFTAGAAGSGDFRFFGKGNLSVVRPVPSKADVRFAGRWLIVAGRLIRRRTPSIAAEDSVAYQSALREAFERTALPHLDHLYTAARYLTGDRPAADDLVQETFLRAYRFFHLFRSGTNCRAWLLTILRNTFRTRYRAERREAKILDFDERAVISAAADAASAKIDPETHLLSNSRASDIAATLEGLPEAQRTAIVLVDLQDLTYEEAARVLECPVGTVRSRLARGRRLLASRIGASRAFRPRQMGGVK